MKKEVTANIGWANGKWAPLNQLMIPITDLGLKLGDGIFETILIFNGQTQLLTSHMDRWQKSASLLNMAPPPSKTWIQPLIDEAIHRTSLPEGNGALRLNWTRGDQFSQGINIHQEVKKQVNHRFWLEVRPSEPCFDSITTMISRYEKRNSYSQHSQCKTFAYGQSIQARYEAHLSGYDEALLLSTNGELCCGTTANLVIQRHAEWITPRLASGCLPGIMRQQGLKCGLFKEAIINNVPFEGDKWMLINSLGCRPIKKVNNHSLDIYSKPKELWMSLLKTKL